MRNKLLKHLNAGIFQGAFIGLILSILFSYLAGSGRYAPAPPSFMNHFKKSTTAMFVSLLLWISIGLIFSFSSLIFEETDWSIVKMTVVHFFITYFGFLPLAILAGWFPVKFLNIFIFTLIYIVIYILMWFISMYRAKKEITSINLEIQNRNNK